jgi:hypothetical protein
VKLVDGVEKMKIPTRTEAEVLIEEAREMNPGPWVEHSRYVAKAAEAIARHHPRLDPEATFVMGTLHDIGRRAGVAGMRHVIDGYTFLMEKGFDDAARICLTHSYPTGRAQAVPGKWDGSEKELTFIRKYIAKIEFDEYDKLIQLCDALSLPSGFCLMEKRLIDVALRYGTDKYSVPRWKAYLALQVEFEKAIGMSIYKMLPGVVENTFGFEG